MKNNFDFNLFLRKLAQLESATFRYRGLQHIYNICFNSDFSGRIDIQSESGKESTILFFNSTNYEEKTFEWVNNELNKLGIPT